MIITGLLKNLTRKNIWNDYKEVSSESYLNKLKETGHKFTEEKREGAYLYDEKGRKYLDCYSGAGTFNLGRRPDELAQTFIEELKRCDQGNFVFISREKARLAEKLIEFVPAKLQGCFFSVMRGEAMDYACKLARGYTGRSGLITVDGASYGQTGFALSMSERSDKALYGSLIPDINIIPFGSISAINESVNKNTAAVVLEPFQAENTCRTSGREFFKALRDACSQKGALLIIDETQTGMGRTGKKFAFEDTGVFPDILIVGESIGAGMFPITATLYTKKIKKFVDNHPLIHLSTFGGHDLGCRVACRALELYNEKKPWKTAEKTGEEIIRALENLSRQYPDKLKSVTGRGLLISLNTPSEKEGLTLCRKLAENGIIAAQGEVARQSVVLRPPLIIGKEEVDLIINAVEKALQ